MIVVTVSFPEKTFLSHGVYGKALPFPAPTQILCSFLSTGNDDNEVFVSALDKLSCCMPTIVCGYTPEETGRQRVSTIGEIGKFRKGVSTTEREGASPSTFLSGVPGYTGIKHFSTSDDRYVIPGDVYYVYDIGDDEESIVDSLSPFVGFISSVGKSSTAVFDIATCSSHDALHAAYAVSREHGNTSKSVDNFTVYTPCEDTPYSLNRARNLVMDTPTRGYVSEMIGRYSNPINRHPVNVINTTYIRRSEAGNTNDRLTIGFSPQPNWDDSMHKIINLFQEKTPDFDEKTTYFIPHLLYSHGGGKKRSSRKPHYSDPLQSITIVVEEEEKSNELFGDFMLLCRDVFGDSVYENRSMYDAGTISPQEGAIWQTTLPYRGHKSALATQLSIMGYIKKNVGVDFSDFTVSISPHLYTGYENFWDVQVSFTTPQNRRVSISPYNQLVPVDTGASLL